MTRRGTHILEDTDENELIDLRGLAHKKGALCEIAGSAYQLPPQRAPEAGARSARPTWGAFCKSCLRKLGGLLQQNSTAAAGVSQSGLHVLCAETGSPRISGHGRKILSPAAAENFQPKSTGTLEISSPTFFLENIFDDTHTHLGHLTSPCRPLNQVVPAWIGILSSSTESGPVRIRAFQHALLSRDFYRSELSCMHQI